jgi:hypothetical protein
VTGTLDTDLAGVITVTVRTTGGKVSDVVTSSTRPTDFSRRLFSGRDPRQVLDTLPLVFSICATAQSSAAVQAIEQAVGVTVAPAHAAARELLVLAETAREHLFRILLGWSTWLSLPPAGPRLAALGRMRSAWSQALYPDGDAFRPGGGRLQPDNAALDTALQEAESLVDLALGIAHAEWSAIADEGALVRWAGSSDAVAARMVRHVCDAGLASLGRCDVALLPPLSDAVLGGQMLADDAGRFIAAPTWNDSPRETSALQRRADAPLIRALTAGYANGLLTRQSARLDELVATLARMAELVANLAPERPGEAASPDSGQGIAQVEAARGRLAHAVVLERGEVVDYRILAPTEWNFHPGGPLARGLVDMPAGEGLKARAQLLVDAIDPCVDARIQVTRSETDA